jgi:hypothetical protein
MSCTDHTIPKRKGGFSNKARADKELFMDGKQKKTI